MLSSDSPSRHDIQGPMFIPLTTVSVSLHSLKWENPQLKTKTNESDYLGTIRGLSVKALAGPCRTEPTIVTEVGLRRMTIFGTGFYNLIKSEVNIDEL